MRAQIESRIRQSIALKQALISDSRIMESMEEAVARMIACFAQGGKILFCGNGGSAADAQHLAAEFSGRFYQDRDPLPAEALHANSSYLTAVANDYGYDQVYRRLVRGIGRPGDMLVGLSTSGNSPNVVLAMSQARELGMHTLAMTGEGGGRMKEYADLILAVPSRDTPRIQEAHMLLGHIICEAVEAGLFMEGNEGNDGK